ncbi:hypothetical protein GCM10016272_15480 [Psychrobacter glaciei]|uniref:Uncharacterized protein n=1 Tax=Psychrobacter glaciei TaxID=619771 RepID=A0ABQ3GQJ7_9GAMM|nr:hypothetical protein GCM10016272_15480 [Psychrobacter glaciei]
MSVLTLLRSRRRANDDDVYNDYAYKKHEDSEHDIRQLYICLFVKYKSCYGRKHDRLCRH